MFIMVINVNKLVYRNRHMYIGIYKFADGNNWNILQSIDKHKHVFGNI